MPVYEFKCSHCVVTYEMVFKIIECPEEINCHVCHNVAKKIISRPQNMRPNWEPYFDENLDVVITGREHRRKLMKEQGLETKYIDPSVTKERKQKMEHKRREGIKNGR